MTLGERIKALREQLGLSQPQLAERAGIEQSFLSKLENAKSIPSNDTLRSLLGALEIDLDKLLEGLPEHYIQANLKSVADIERWWLAKQVSAQHSRSRVLTRSAAAVALGITLFYSGYASLFVSSTRYFYESEGVVLAGEPIDYFDNGWRIGVTDENREAERMLKESRYDPHSVVIDQNRGLSFAQAMENGRRHYRWKQEIRSQRWQNSVLQAFGVLCVSAGVMGFVWEARMSAKKA